MKNDLLRDLKKARARLAELQKRAVTADLATNALRQKVADRERLLEYARRHTDHIAKIAEQLVASLHKIAAPQAEQGNWDPMKLLLTIGSRPEGDGIQLTEPECWLLFRVLNGERRPPLRRGRRRAPEIDIRAFKIANYSRLLELDGEPTEAAVKATEQLFSVNRSTVFAARRHLPFLAAAVPDDPAARRSLIAAFKSSPTKSAN